MLDTELAAMCGVETRQLVQAVERNIDRFPSDFMFQLTADEFALLRSQAVISKPAGRGGRRIAPYAFTEQGVVMLSSVLGSHRAVRVNIEIMRAFVRLRPMLQQNTGLARKLAALERKYDGRFRMVFEAIRGLMPPIPRAKPRRLPRTRADTRVVLNRILTSSIPSVSLFLPVLSPGGAIQRVPPAPASRRGAGRMICPAVGSPSPGCHVFSAVSTS